MMKSKLTTKKDNFVAEGSGASQDLSKKKLDPPAELMTRLAMGLKA
jgi:hypothetical protein